MLGAITRFFREIWTPALKCARVGHSMKTDILRIRKSGGGYRIVATDYSVKRDYCTRCGRKEEPRDLMVIDSWNGCQMPKHMWDKIEKQGYVEI